MPRIDITKNFERHRIAEPSLCIPDSFRTQDIGRPGYSQRVACRSKRTGKWITQSLLISHSEPIEMKRRLRKSASALKSRMKKNETGISSRYHPISGDLNYERHKERVASEVVKTIRGR